MRTAKVEPNYDEEMKLAADKTCDDCIHSRRCFAFGFSKSGRKSCDFWPNRFREAQQQPVTPT